MKTAIVHDWLIDIGGSENCLKEFCLLFPEADLYTLVYKNETLRQLGIAPERTTASFISRLPFSKKKYRSYLPLFPLAVEQFDLTGYDLVVSSSHAVAKGVLTTARQIHICYCYTPSRYAWDLYHQYLQEADLTRGVKSVLARIAMHYIRLWDQLACRRVDHFIAISYYIAERINKIYGKEAAVIYPPVDVERFAVNTGKRQEFYLTASRMVPYKKIPLIVDAFARMPQKKLVVIGDGPEMKQVRARAGSNIEILGHQSFEILKERMQQAKAFVFAAEEDFGILPVEAQACGTPVIAFGRGGAAETVVENKTGIFFDEQSVESLIQAVEGFEKICSSFDPRQIRAHAVTFSRERFRSEMENFMEQKIRENRSRSLQHEKPASKS